MCKSYTEEETIHSIIRSLGFSLATSKLRGSVFFVFFYELHFHEGESSMPLDSCFPLHGIRDQTDPVVFLIA